LPAAGSLPSSEKFPAPGFQERAGDLGVAFARISVEIEELPIRDPFAELVVSVKALNAFCCLTD